LAVDSQAFLDELVCLPLTGEGGNNLESILGRGENNLESILPISPVADLSDPVAPLQGAGMQVYNSFSGCRNHSAVHGAWATHSSAL
jgi:hypothetical protein